MAILVDRYLHVGAVDVRVLIERELHTTTGEPALLVERATVSARHGGCGGLEIEAAAGSYFFALGRQDAITGHAAFDDRYIVKTSDVEAMRYWLGEHELEAVLATYDPHALHPYSLTVDAEEVRLVGSWELLDGPGATALGALSPIPRLVGGLDQAATAVATLASRGARLAAAWSARLAPLGLVDAGGTWRADDRYGLVVERGRTSVRLDFPWQLHPLRRRGLRTRLSIAWPDPGAAAIWPRTWSFRTRPRIARGDDLDLPAPWHGEARDAPALGALPQLGPTLTALSADWLLASDGTLSLGWERIVDDTHRLTVAIAQLERWAELVAPSHGPYR